jgi:hypothetical protein
MLNLAGTHAGRRCALPPCGALDMRLGGPELLRRILAVLGLVLLLVSGAPATAEAAVGAQAARPPHGDRRSAGAPAGFTAANVAIAQGLPLRCQSRRDCPSPACTDDGACCDGPCHAVLAPPGSAGQRVGVSAVVHDHQMDAGRSSLSDLGLDRPPKRAAG